MVWITSDGPGVAPKTQGFFGGLGARVLSAAQGALQNVYAPAQPRKRKRNWWEPEDELPSYEAPAPDVYEPPPPLYAAPEPAYEPPAALPSMDWASRVEEFAGAAQSRLERGHWLNKEDGSREWVLDKPEKPKETGDSFWGKVTPNVIESGINAAQGWSDANAEANRRRGQQSPFEAITQAGPSNFRSLTGQETSDVPGGKYGQFAVEEAFNPINYAALGVSGTGKLARLGGAILGPENAPLKRAGVELAAGIGARVAGEEAAARLPEDIPLVPDWADPYVRGAAALGAGAAGGMVGVGATRGLGPGVRSLDEGARGVDARWNEPAGFEAGGRTTAGMERQVFHGTPDEALTLADLKPGELTGKGTSTGLFFTENPDVAGSYLGRWKGKTIEATIEDKNFLDLTDEKTFHAFLLDQGWDESEARTLWELASEGRLYDDNVGRTQKTIITYAKNAGYDGVKMNDAVPGFFEKGLEPVDVSYVVLDPSKPGVITSLKEATPTGPASRGMDVPEPRPVTAEAPVARAEPPVVPPRTTAPASSPIDLSRLDVPAELTRTDKFVNLLKKPVGGIPEHEQVTGILRASKALDNDIASAASAFGQRSSALARVFKRDKLGRITTLSDQPTIQDLAANLPRWADELTPDQMATMRQLEADSASFAKLLQDVGIEVGQRADVKPGGFYLHRGGADLEGALEPVKVGSGRSGRGGKTASERPTTFASMSEGLSKGYRYDEFGQAMEDYAKSVSRRAADEKVATYFKNLTDEVGNPIGRGYTERLMDRNPAIKGQWTRATQAMASVRGRLATAERRAGLAAGKADELDTAMTKVEARLPDEGTRGLSKLPAQLRQEEAAIAGMPSSARDISERLQQPPGQPGVRIKMPVTKAEIAAEAARAKEVGGRAGARQGVVDRIKALVPDDADKMRFLDTAVANTRKRIDALEARGGQYAVQAKQLRNQLGLVQDRVDQLRTPWQKAQEIARMTPRNEGRVGLAQLGDLTFPDPIANAANKWLTKNGKESAPVAVINAVNRLARGTMTTLDNSAAGIQGILGLGEAPQAYRRALVAMVKAWGDPDAAGKALLMADERSILDGTLTTQQWAADGMHFGASQTEFKVGMGLQGAPGIRQSNRAFGTFGDVQRREWGDAELLSEMAARGKTAAELRADGTTRRIADAASKMTGWSDKRFAGDWGELLTFAPRYLQSRLETLGNAMVGTAKGTTPLTRGIGTSVEQRMAAKSMQKFIGWSVLTTVAVNEAMGNETDYRPVDDGRWNANFMRIRFNGRDYSLLGTYDGLARLIVGVGEAGKTLATDPNPTHGLGELANAVRSQASPSLSWAWDTIAGEDFLGNPTRENWGQIVQRIGESFVPISGGEQVKQLGAFGKDVVGGDFVGAAKDVATFVATNVGMKSSPTTPFEKFDEDVRKDPAFQKTIDPVTGEERKANGYWDLEEGQQDAADEKHGRPPSTNPETLARQEAYADAKSEKSIEQTESDRLLAEGKLTPLQWRNDLRSRSEYLAGFADAKWGDVPFEDRRVTPLDEYYGMINSMKTPDGKVDWDKIEAAIAGKPEFWQAYVDRNMPAASGTEKVKNYREDVRAIADSGYWDVTEGRTQFLRDHADVRKLAEKWGYSQNITKYLNEEDKFNLEQRNDDAKLEKGLLRKDQWKERFQERTLALRAAGEALFQDSKGVETLGPLTGYYAAIDANTEDGYVNWRKVDQWVAAQSPETQAAIDGRDRKGGISTPRVVAYREAVKKVSASGYWDMGDKIAARFARRFGLPADIGADEMKQAVFKKEFDRFRARGMSAEEAELRADTIADRKLKGFTALLTKQRQQFRRSRKNREIASLLAAWAWWDPGVSDTNTLLRYVA